MSRRLLREGRTKRGEGEEGFWIPLSINSSPLEACGDQMVFFRAEDIQTEMKERRDGEESYIFISLYIICYIFYIIYTFFIINIKKYKVFIFYFIYNSCYILF